MLNLSRDEAYQLVVEKIGVNNLLKHILAVEAGMRQMAEHLNEDVDFFTSKIEIKSQLATWLNFKAGSAYNYVEYASPKDIPYAPKYQVYTSTELNYFWSQKFMNLNAFGELVYSDKYLGRFGGELGNEVIFNAKLSFSIKRFRFHYVFQNIAGTEYNSYEGITIPGRYSYYGITWNFID